MCSAAISRQRGRAVVNPNATLLYTIHHLGVTKLAMCNQSRHLHACCNAQTGRLFSDFGWPGRTQRDRFMDQVTSVTQTATALRSRIGVQFQRILKRHRHLDLCCLTAGRLARSKAVLPAAAQPSKWNIQFGKSLSKSTTVTWAHPASNFTPSNLDGNGALRGCRAARRSRCRIARAIRRGGRVGRDQLNRPLRPPVAGPDPVRSVATIAGLPHCHNFVTGVAAYAAYSHRQHSGHYYSGCIAVRFNLLLEQTTMTWTISEAMRRAPVSAAPIWLSHVHLQVEAASK